MAEYDNADNVTQLYKYGRERLYAQTPDSNGTKTYYLNNPHNDVQGLTDANGNLIKTYEYDAFGVEIDRDENDTNPFRFS